MARHQTTHRFTTRKRLSSSLGLRLSYRRLAQDNIAAYSVRREWAFSLPRRWHDENMRALTIALCLLATLRRAARRLTGSQPANVALAWQGEDVRYAPE